MRFNGVAYLRTVKCASWMFVIASERSERGNLIHKKAAVAVRVPCRGLPRSLRSLAMTCAALPVIARALAPAAISYIRKEQIVKVCSFLL